MPEPGTVPTEELPPLSAARRPHAWLKAVAQVLSGLAGVWGGFALMWRVPDLAPGGWALAAVSLYLLVKGAFRAVHEAARLGQKVASALLVVVAALHFTVALPLLGVGLMAALAAGRGARLREGLEWFL